MKIHYLGHVRYFNRYTLALIIPCLVVLTGCSTEPVSTRFLGIKNNTASFELINNLSEPVQNISIEITKLDIEGNVIEIDTMSYRGATRNGETGPFLEPKEWSMFATSVPEGMTSGKARVLDYNYKE